MESDSDEEENVCSSLHEDVREFVLLWNIQLFVLMTKIIKDMSFFFKSCNVVKGQNGIFLHCMVYIYKEIFLAMEYICIKFLPCDILFK